MAAVARLVWHTFQTRWPDGRLVTLLTEEAPRTLASSTTDRVAFGLRMAAAHATLRGAWAFYNHLSLARVQRLMPGGARRPYVIFLHGIEAWQPLDDAVRRALAGASLRLANSAYTAARIGEIHPDIGPVAVCPLGLPPLWQSAWPTVAGPPIADSIGTHAVTIVARMSAAERYKGHDALLECWPLVLARQPDAQLVVVGTGDDVTRLQEKARVLGISARVVFAGFVDDAQLTAIYRRSAVFAMPSRGEGFGLAYLEAMAHGVACIGSIHDAAGEVIDDGVTGFLVDQADKHGIADRLATLLADPARRQAMGAAGRRRTAERFTADRFARSLGALVEGALESAAPAPAWRASGSR